MSLTDGKKYKPGNGVSKAVDKARRKGPSADEDAAIKKSKGGKLQPKPKAKKNPA